MCGGVCASTNTCVRRKGVSSAECAVHAAGRFLMWGDLV